MFDHWGMPYHPQQSMRTLKMADMQMVEIVKAISFGAKLIIMDEPNFFFYVWAKSEIYSIMQELAEQGIGIILISSDMEEIIGMSDRILVMCEGVINGELDRSEVTQEKIMELASEVKK